MTGKQPRSKSTDPLIVVILVTVIGVILLGLSAGLLYLLYSL